jgi:hypothetical protein
MSRKKEELIKNRKRKSKSKRHFKIPPRKEVKYDKSGIFNENDECEKYTEQEPSQV